jgi:hypothetical protein
MINDLGRDFGKKRGVILGCCCTCCCCCAHTLAAGAAIARGLAAGSQESGQWVWYLPLIVVTGGGALAFCQIYSMTTLLWTVALAGPVIFPVLLVASWALGNLLTLLTGDPSAERARLNRAYSILGDWALTSIGWAVIGLFAMLLIPAFLSVFH